MNYFLPAAWHELRRWQIERLCHLMAENAPQYYLGRGRGIMMAALLAQDNGRPITKSQLADVIGTEEGRRRMADLSGAIDFIKEAPTLPVRPDRLCGRTAIRADFQRVRFGTFLQVTTLWSILKRLAQKEIDGMTADERLKQYKLVLVELVDQLCPPLRRESKEAPALTDDELSLLSAAVMLWMEGLTTMLSGMYPSIFTYRPEEPAVTEEKADDAARALQHAVSVALGGDEEETDGGDDPERTAMLMVRALSGGDVTKVDAVLRTDTHTCLQELQERVEESRKVKASQKA